MGTLAQARDKVDAFLTAAWPTLVARQDNYLTNKGNYWQGLWTHTVAPAFTSGEDGDSIPDRLTVHPTDQFEDWITAFPEWDGVPIPCMVKVDVYTSPAGKGWCAYIRITFNGVTYERSQNVGPSYNLTQAWHIVEET